MLDIITEESISRSPSSKLPSPTLQSSIEGEAVSDQKCIKNLN